MKSPWKKGIKTVHYPMMSIFGGESEKAIQRVLKEKHPKLKRIIFKREILIDEKYGYDATEVILSKD